MDQNSVRLKYGYMLTLCFIKLLWSLYGLHFNIDQMTRRTDNVNRIKHTPYILQGRNGSDRHPKHQKSKIPMERKGHLPRRRIKQGSDRGFAGDGFRGTPVQGFRQLVWTAFWSFSFYPLCLCCTWLYGVIITFLRLRTCCISSFYFFLSSLLWSRWWLLWSSPRGMLVQIWGLLLEELFCIIYVDKHDSVVISFYGWLRHVQFPVWAFCLVSIMINHHTHPCKCCSLSLILPF